MEARKTWLEIYPTKKSVNLDINLSNERCYKKAIMPLSICCRTVEEEEKKMTTRVVCVAVL